MTQPVRYEPTVERVESDKAETIRGLEEQFKIILDTTSSHAVRSVHAKGRVSTIEFGFLTANRSDRAANR